MSRMSVLGRVVGRGAAKHGAGHWWAQRVTAVALIVLSTWFIVSLLWIPTIDYLSLTIWMSRGWNALLLIAFIIVVAHHSYLGLCVVLEDYVHDAGARIGVLLLLRFAHVLMAAAAVFAVLDAVFGVIA